MMNATTRRLKYVLAVLVMIGLSGIGLNASAVPTPGFCNSHSLLRTSPTQQGGYYSAVNINMNGNWNSTARNFVLRTMWVGTGTGSDWIELGFMDGDMNGSYHHGFYAASTYPQYTEMPIYGFSTTPGLTHNYEVQYVGNGVWRAYVDFTQVNDYSNSGYYGTGVEVGFESGSFSTPYTNFTYDSPNYTSAHEYLDYSTNTWKYWSSGVPDSDNGCNNSSVMPSASWGSDYSKGVFTHP